MIYVIRAGGSSYYKIGYTSKDSASCRVKQLQTGNPLQLSVVLTFDGDESDEAYWQLYFAHKMTEARNEWFELTENDLRIFEDGKNKEFQRSVDRDSPFDVRQVCGGQRDKVAARAKNVPNGRSPFDSTQHQSVFVVGGREYVKRGEDVLREVVANDCDGDQGLHVNHSV